MAVRFVSRIALANRFLNDLAYSTMKAVALFVEGQAKREARGGFKSGTFVTRGWQSIRHEIVRTGVAGQVRAFVGSTEKHFMWWEMGHHNLFTRRYERNRWLTRAMTTGRTLRDQAALAAAQQVASRYGGLAAASGARTLVLGNIRARPHVGPSGRLPR